MAGSGSASQPLAGQPNLGSVTRRLVSKLAPTMRAVAVGQADRRRLRRSARIPSASSNRIHTIGA
jgi:hypothetical protein